MHGNTTKRVKSVGYRRRRGGIAFRPIKIFIIFTDNRHVSIELNTFRTQKVIRRSTKEKKKGVSYKKKRKKKNVTLIYVRNTCFIL